MTHITKTLSRILCLAKVKCNMIATQAQYHAVASRIEQIRNAPTGSEAAKELKVLRNLMADFESQRQQLSIRKDPSEQLHTTLHRL